MIGDLGRAGVRIQVLEAGLLLVAALLFGRVCTLPLALAEKAHLEGMPPAWLLPLDDAYVFVRYAQQAARGRPWEWNAGEPSSGASSALWPWLLVPAHWISGGGGPPAVAAAAGAARGPWPSAELAAWSRWSRWVGLASLWCLGLAAARLLRAASLPEPWPLAGALCVTWSGPVGFGAVAGMESALNAALLAMACALWIETLRAGSGPAVGRGSDCRQSRHSLLVAGAAGSPPPAPSTPAVRRHAGRLAALWATALLPLVRPENAALTLLAALVLLGGRLPWRRRAAAAVLMPAVILAGCNRLATGSFEPAGAVAKSWVALPFLPTGARVASYLAVLQRGLLPVYAGVKPAALWPPVGALAALTAAAVLWGWFLRPARGLGGEGGLGGATSSRAGAAAAPAWRSWARGQLVALAPLAPLAVAWLTLATLAPFSSLLLWQEMRHHHGGLALAWLLALAGVGLGTEALAARHRDRSRAMRDGPAPPETGVARPEAAMATPGTVVATPGSVVARPSDARPRWRVAVLLLPLPLVLAFPHWARESTRAGVELYRGHWRAAAWLAAEGHERTLLLNDAGLLAIAHDGPQIDALGLGSPDLTEPALHGPGALAESLARRRRLPEIAAVEPALLGLPQLLGEPLIPGPPLPGETTVLVRARRELLAGTPLDGPGLDFAYLPDERRHAVHWQPPPLLPPWSVALLLPGPGTGAGTGSILQGCRPLLGRMVFEVPAGVGAVRLRAALLAPGGDGGIAAGLGGVDGPSGAPLAVARLTASRWSELVVALPERRSSRLWVARRGDGLPCLESAGFGGRSGVRR